MLENALKSGNLAEAYTVDENETEAKIVKTADSHVMTIITPEEFSGWQITVRCDGHESAPFNMNVPEIKWVQNDAAVVGDELRVFGQCFATPDCYGDIDVSGDEVHGFGRMLSDGHGVSVFLCDCNGGVHELPVTAASCYEVRANVPACVLAEKVRYIL